jgi:hypothetical protein
VSWCHLVAVTPRQKVLILQNTFKKAHKTRIKDILNLCKVGLGAYGNLHLPKMNMTGLRQQSQRADITPPLTIDRLLALGYTLDDLHDVQSRRLHQQNERKKHIDDDFSPSKTFKRTASDAFSSLYVQQPDVSRNQSRSLRTATYQDKDRVFSQDDFILNSIWRSYALETAPLP